MSKLIMSPWFSTYGLPQQEQVRIFAFPYSGSGASVFYKWAQSFQSNPCDLIGVQLPGRESRIRENLISDLQSLVKELLTAITPLLDKPFVFFGHSLGGLVAFELSRALREQGLPMPQHLFISAFRSPELSNPNRELHQLSDADFIENIRDYAGIAEEILANQELMSMFLPALRADFNIHETYQYVHEAPLTCPITVLSGKQDNIVKAESMNNWQQQTSTYFQHKDYDGNHFFLHENQNNIIRLMQQQVLIDCQSKEM